MRESERREQLAKAYGFALPEDFWRFCRFYQELEADQERGLLGSALGISVIGPMDWVQGYLQGKSFGLPLCLHYRYFMDPPEFITVLSGDTDGQHWGYWIDDPRETEFLVASYHTCDAYEITVCGKTLLEAVRLELELQYAGALEVVEEDEDDEDDEDETDCYRQKLAKLERLRRRLIAYETSERTETGWDYVEQWEDIPRQMTAPTLDKMGIVVPPDSFRSWSEAELQLKWIHSGKAGQLTLEQDEAADLYRLAQAFLAEGKAGNALQIGKDLWFFGKLYAELAYPILDAAYRALDREALAEILTVHRQHRHRKSVDIRESKADEGGK